MPNMYEEQQKQAKKLSCHCDCYIKVERGLSQLLPLWGSCIMDILDLSLDPYLM